MKNSAWYNKLWQSKMQELPLQGDEHAAWQKMQGLLNQHLPVKPVVPKFKLALTINLKLISALVIGSIVSAVIIYSVYHLTHKNHHKKPVKHTTPHSNTDSIRNNNSITPSAQKSNGDNMDTVNKTGDTTNDKQISNNQTALSNQLASNNSSTSQTTGNAGHITGNGSSNSTNNRARTSGSNGAIGNVSKRRNTGHITITTHKRTALTYRNALHKSGSQTTATNNKETQTSDLQTPNDQLTPTNASHQLLSDQSLSIENKVSIPYNSYPKKDTVKNASPDLANDTTKNNKQTNTKTINTTTSNSKSKDRSKTSGSNKKASVSKTSGISNWGLNTIIGITTNKGTNINPFLGISGSYGISNKLSISIGVNAPSTRIISGTYSKSNLNYITIGDSSKKITHNSGLISISSTKKIYDIDIPILLSYQLSNSFTIIGGPVMSVPYKSETINNKLGPLSSSADTTTLRTVTPYVNSTVINTKLNFGFSAGLQYNFNRFYFDVSYLQAASPYTVGSGLGSGKIYYRTVQVGVGYRIFKAKKKK